jgi:hypothetical protein
MIELTEEQASVLKQGYPVRIAAPQLGGEIIVLLADDRESTEAVLQETLDDLREKAALSRAGQRAASSWMRENPF